ncbi:cadherin repeat domain-containing protein [Erythrobacter ani]|uniref:Cadherin repeat domain-containing protein n=1 Tax=Erythrobacter ani TaxID=2827235 RepID=A0ABS6SPM6_9SPHN|nr:cadherin repeat domain-containing protein [Erythrobacter ani]MBV7266422.1 cadherin repeat domain-containing protein [Erythrobacter ani]
MPKIASGLCSLLLLRTKGENGHLVTSVRSLFIYNDLSIVNFLGVVSMSFFHLSDQRVLVGILVPISLMLGACGGGGSSSPSPTPTPTPVATAPTFTSSSAASVVENTDGTFYTATASDPQNDPLTFDIFAGVDASAFVIDSNGSLRFVEVPNFDLPNDADLDNTYEVTLRVQAGGEQATLALSVEVTNDREGIVVRRVADGIVDPVAMAQIAGEPILLIAERNGRVLRFNQDDNSVVEDIFIRDNRRPGEILAIGAAFFSTTYQKGIYMVTHSPTDGLMLQAFNADRGTTGFARLADPWTEPTTVSFIYQPEVLIAIGSPTQTDAQDPSTMYGKLVRLPFVDPFAGASLPRNILIRPEVIGDGMQRPGGFALPDSDSRVVDSDLSILADRGSSVFHELTVFGPNWRPLDFGWPNFEGSEAVTADPPDQINGPNLIYEVGDGPKQGEGVIAGQLFRSSFDPAFGDSFVFFDVNGTVFSIESEKLADGFLHSADEFEDKTQDFQPDQGEIGTLVGYGAGIASTFFYLLDSDGELFEVSQETD